MSRVSFLPLSALALVCALSSSGAYSGAMLGAYVDYDGWNTTTIDQFNSAAVKPMAVINVFSGFSQDWISLTTQATNIVSRNAAPMITWMPSVSDRPDANLFAEITAGQWNTYLDNWIKGLKAWQATYPSTSKPTILLRFAHEFNGNWYPWGNDPDGLKAAWRYIYSRFKTAGVTNVEWVWCANNSSVDSYNDITRYYPGDDVVNWTALDGYNWGSNYSFSQWKSFAETFSAPYTKLITNYPTKPVLLAEVASVEPSDVPNPTYGQDGNDNDAGQSKEVWVQDMYTRIMSEYPAIRAIAWFNTNKEFNWALTGAGNTGLNAYNATVINSYYSGSFTPLTTTTTTTKTTRKKATASTSTIITTASTLDASTSAADSSTTVENLNEGLQRALALSHMPTVVGENLLAREAQGFRSLAPDALKTLRTMHVEGQ
jgi:beta-mannanase